MISRHSTYTTQWAAGVVRGAEVKVTIFNRLRRGGGRAIIVSLYYLLEVEIMVSKANKSEKVTHD